MSFETYWADVPAVTVVFQEWSQTIIIIFIITLFVAGRLVETNHHLCSFIQTTHDEDDASLNPKNKNNQKESFSKWLSGPRRPRQLGVVDEHWRSDGEPPGRGHELILDLIGLRRQCFQTTGVSKPMAAAQQQDNLFIRSLV